MVHAFWRAKPLAFTIVRVTCGLCDQMHLLCFTVWRLRLFCSMMKTCIRFRGAMTTFITDGGRYEISKKVADLLRSLFIKQYESELYHQHQNKAEQRYGVDVPLHNIISLFSFILMLMVWFRLVLLDEETSEEVSNLFGYFISTTISDEGSHSSPESDIVI